MSTIPTTAIRIVLSGAMLIAAGAGVALAQSADCSAEAGRIHRAEGELPKLSVAPPEDRQIVCITLETNLVFARRLAGHLQSCPRSPYAKAAETWARYEAAYAAQFSGRNCKPAIKSYRG
jgi:hypothetical protein